MALANAVASRAGVGRARFRQFDRWPSAAVRLPGASGNVATEDVVLMLEPMGLHTGVDLMRSSPRSTAAPNCSTARSAAIRSAGCARGVPEQREIRSCLTVSPIFAARLSPWVDRRVFAYAAVFVEVDVSPSRCRKPFVEGRDLFFGGRRRRAALVRRTDGALLSMDDVAPVAAFTQPQPANLQAAAARRAGACSWRSAMAAVTVRNGDGA